MKKKMDVDKFDFEEYISDALKSHGFLFPENEGQMSIYEESMNSIPLPSELHSPSFVLDNNKRNCALKVKIDLPMNTEAESNWATAAREGKDIPIDIWEQMKRDKEAAKKK